MSKLNKLSKLFGAKVEDLIREMNCDRALCVMGHGDALAICCAGEKNRSKEESLDFLRDAVSRLQKIIDTAENGELDMEANTDGYVYCTDEGTFQTLEEWEASQPDTTGFST